MPIQKSYLAKIFSENNSTFLKTIPHGSGGLKSLPTFQSRINGGLGEMVLDLDMPLDELDTSIDFMHIVDLYVVDGDNPRGRRIYRGFISKIDPYFEGQEGIRVTCLGLVSLLSFSLYGSSTAYSVTHTTVDPEAIAQAVITNFNAAFGGSLLSYSGTTSTVGTNVTKVFTGRTWAEALNDAKDLAGTDWWWFIDKDGQLYFKAKPGTATHRFTLGKDCERFSFPKTMEGVVNEVIVERSGGTRTAYTDATSQTTYGTGSPATSRYTKLISDSTISDATTAGQRGNKLLNDKKDAKVKGSLVVNTNFDLESIQPGHTCQIANFNKDFSFFGSNNFFIASVAYAGDTVTLELEQPDADFGLALDNFVNG